MHLPAEPGPAREQALRSLRVERIELHRIDPATPLADQLGTLRELHAAGKVGAVRGDRPASWLLDREHEPVLRACAEARIALLPWRRWAWRRPDRAPGGERRRGRASAEPGAAGTPGRDGLNFALELSKNASWDTGGMPGRERDSQTSSEQRRRVDEIFGDVLPETTSDERDPDRRTGLPDDWYRENRPPHHDR
jgi:hypothetical protein